MAKEKAGLFVLWQWVVNLRLLECWGRGVGIEQQDKVVWWACVPGGAGGQQPGAAHSVSTGDTANGGEAVRDPESSAPPDL